MPQIIYRTTAGLHGVKMQIMNTKHYFRWELQAEAWWLQLVHLLATCSLLSLMNWLWAHCNPAHLISTMTSTYCVCVSVIFFLILSPLLSFVLSCQHFSSFSSPLCFTSLWPLCSRFHHISRNLTNKLQESCKLFFHCGLYLSLPIFFTYTHKIILITPFLSPFFFYTITVPTFYPHLLQHRCVLDVPPLEANPWLSVFCHANFPSPNILHLHCNPSSALLLLACCLFFASG